MRPSDINGRERREAERAIAYWVEKRQESGGPPAVGALDLEKIGSPDWSYRFLIATDAVVERSLLLMYGKKFAELFGLPERTQTNLPITRQLPSRYSNVFMRGCVEVQEEMAPVRLEGEVERADGRIEQYRAGFTPVGVRPEALTWFAFGAFNRRIVEPATTL